MHLARGHAVDQRAHPRNRILTVAALREAVHHLLEGVIGLARGRQVALGSVLARPAGNQPGAIAEVHESLQVIRVVQPLVGRMQPDEAVDGGERLGPVAFLVVRPGDVQLRLLRITAERIARFQALHALDGTGPVARIQICLGIGIQLLGRPVRGGVLVGGCTACQQHTCSHHRQPARGAACRGPAGMGRAGALHPASGHPGGTKPPETRLRRCVRIMLPCHLPAALPHPNIPPNKRPIIDSPPAARAKRPVARAATKRIGWSRPAFTPSRHRLLTTIDYTRRHAGRKRTSRQPARPGILQLPAVPSAPPSS